VLEHSGHGFSHARGPDTAPIAFMGEAPGPEELKAGVPFVGPAGSMHARLLRMIGKDQDHYKLFNTVSCCPPYMELAGTPYERQAIDQCRYREAVLANPAHTVVVTLGAVATRTMLGLGKGASIEDLHGTVHRVGERWVVPTYHPSHLQRGAHNLTGVVLFDLQRAEEVAASGWAADPASLVEDPPLDWFTAWVDMVVENWQRQPGSFWLSCDIETPDKAGGKSEGELTPDDLSYVIERVNWSCNPDEGVTVPYVGGYIAQCDRLLRLNPTLLLWNEDYDLRRLANAGHPIPDVTYDGMEMWHLLQSDLPRGLGFVAPFYSRFGAWKHLARVNPSYYAAVDALQNQRACYGIAADLQKLGQWDTFLRHVYQLRKYALRPAEQIGIRIDEPELDRFIADMTSKARAAMQAIQPLVPEEVCPLVPEAGLKKAPTGPYTKATDLKRDGTKKKQPGDELKLELFAAAKLIQKLVLREITVCASCGKTEIAKTHRCEDRALQPKIELQVATVERWFWQEPYNPDSRDQLLAYVKLRGHQPGRAKKTGNESVDRKTLERLWSQTRDPVYKHQIDLRAVQKVRGTYGIGMKRRLREGRVHGRFTFKPSTQRLSSVDPNLQNVVGDKGDSNTLAHGFRQCVVARPGCRLAEFDYSGIEAVLTGWVAQDPSYIRLAQLGPHGCLAYLAIGEAVDLSEPDDVLMAKFKRMKSGAHPATQADPFLYDRSKRVVHGCLAPDHEVLTPTGWVRLDQYVDGTPVAQWDNGALMFVVPTAVTRTPHQGDVLVVLEGRSLSAQMTVDHRLPYAVHGSPWREVTAATLPKQGNIPSAGVLEGTETVAPDLLRLMVAVQADATVGNSIAVFHLVKPRKLERLRALLDRLEATYTDVPCACHPTGRRITLGADLTNLACAWLEGKAKRFHLPAFLRLTAACREIVIAELPYWDGSRVERRLYRYFTTDRAQAERVQTLAATLGRQALLREQSKGQKFGQKPCFSVSFNARTNAAVESLKRSTRPYRGLVYCLTVPSTYFLIKHHDRISVTGNTSYGLTEYGMHENWPTFFPTLASGKSLITIFYNQLAPKIRDFHRSVRMQAQNDHFLGGESHPFRYRHWFWSVVNYQMISAAQKYTRQKAGGWCAEINGRSYAVRWGEDSKRAIAFFPQSIAAGILKEAMLKLFTPGYTAQGAHPRLAPAGDPGGVL